MAAIPSGDGVKPRAKDVIEYVPSLTLRAYRLRKMDKTPGEEGTRKGTLLWDGSYELVLDRLQVV